MKLLRVSSCIVLASLWILSSYATAHSMQEQAERERELSASLAAGQGFNNIGGLDDFGFNFTVRAQSGRLTPFGFNNGFGDPFIMNGFNSLNSNPGRPGSGFSINQPIRR